MNKSGLTSARLFVSETAPRVNRHQQRRKTAQLVQHWH
jgi:hypothetical protein